MVAARGEEEYAAAKAALGELDRTSLDPRTVANTLGAILKYQDDIARIQGPEGEALLAEIMAAEPVA